MSSAITSLDKILIFFKNLILKTRFDITFEIK